MWGLILRAVCLAYLRIYGCVCWGVKKGSQMECVCEDKSGGLRGMRQLCLL